MKKRVRIFQFHQSLSEDDLNVVSTVERDDICFFHFVGGNPGETDEMIEDLYCLKEQKVFLFGIFRFPFKFEGKKRLQTAIVQYHRMNEICDVITYFDSDGMMDILEPGTSVRNASKTFESLEEGPVRAMKEIINLTGEINIDVKDIQTLVKEDNGPLFVRTIEGESFDEPLKYAISAPYLPGDYAEGRQMMINIGYAKEVDMSTFRQMTLRLNDLFHKADLFKFGTYYLDEPGKRFKITLFVCGIDDPYPRPQQMKQMTFQGYLLKRKWRVFVKRCRNCRWISNMIKQQHKENEYTK